MFCEYGLKRKPSQGASVLWHLRVAEGDHLTECSEGRKLPQHKTRALAFLRKLKTLLGGAPGGVQRGPRRGAAPNRPPLPHAGQASQSPFRRKNYAPEVQRNTTPNTLLISSAVRLRIFAGGSDHCDSGGLESAPNLQGSMPVWMFG